MKIERRELIKAAGGLAILAGLGRQAVWAKALGDNPFTLGVASGDPAPDGFVIWTRLALKPLEPGGGMPMEAVPIGWEVAEDDSFRRVVHSGSELARPALGHSVHVEVGGLKPGYRYWYRFTAGSEMSPAGTARSTPASRAHMDRVRIGVAGCQHYEQGLFTAYAHLAREPDLDAVFHYGDYIYEGGSVRQCSPADGDAGICRAHVGHEIYTLNDYRRRYAQYKTDPDLQAAHAAAAFLSSWDDHEVDNNWAGAEDQDGRPPEVFALRRAVAMQAWYENMPVRRAQFPAFGALRMHRRIDYGDLLRIHVLDTRQYRSGQICHPNKADHCRAIGEGPATILGAGQEAWLGEGLNNGARWNLLAQQVMVMPFVYPESRPAGRINSDSWSGYPAARERLVKAIGERKLGNVVIATGDVHQHHAGVLPAREGAFDGPAAATEFVCTSISSGSDGSDLAPGWEGVPATNPQCQLFNARRGYQLFDIGRDQWNTDVRTVDRVTSAGGTLSTAARFTVAPQKPGLHKS